MFSMFGPHPVITQMAKREEGIIRCMTLMPMTVYNVHPSYDQFAALIVEAEQQGYTLDRLYQMFASGKMDSTIDALFRKHAPNWPPAGQTIDSETSPKSRYDLSSALKTMNEFEQSLRTLMAMAGASQAELTGTERALLLLAQEPEEEA